ncbi:unnamed protein product [Nezara viridula]|uniref:Chitin-binding type-2 domain-containing protein n=1 Tax=Nezara viridula TaxID=85310 RepID=A0A9P0E268_NEZVI|nr:unnamed protein product [Nezara viridula]
MARATTYTVSCFILSAFVLSSRGQAEAPVSTVSSSQPVRQCTGAGQICATCDTVSVCIANVDGSITSVNQSCHADENCVDGQCVQGALCNYRPFQCSEDGFYPDPYDCTKYHVCVGAVGRLSFQCPEGTSYDALSSSCGYPLNTTACIDRPVPDCSQRLQIGAVPTNPNLYYICVEHDGTLAPELYQCPGGYTFNAAKLSCKGAEETSSGKKDKKKSKKSKE